MEGYIPAYFARTAKHVGYGGEAVFDACEPLLARKDISRYWGTKLTEHVGSWEMMSVRLMFVLNAALTETRKKQRGMKSICNFIAKMRKGIQRISRDAVGMRTFT